MLACGGSSGGEEREKLGLRGVGELAGTEGRGSSVCRRGGVAGEGFCVVVGRGSGFLGSMGWVGGKRE